MSMHASKMTPSRDRQVNTVAKISGNQERDLKIKTGSEIRTSVKVLTVPSLEILCITRLLLRIAGPDLWRPNPRSVHIPPLQH